MKEDGQRYCSVRTTVQTEVVVKRSRFIAVLSPAETIEEVRQYLENIRKRYTGATHYCYAYRLGVGGQIYRFNDDGEPPGTAGKPIYSVLMSQDLIDVLLVVVRYFGGIKLGAGGLVRAYRQAAATVVRQAEIITKIAMSTLRVRVDYGDVPYLHQYCHQHCWKYHVDYDTESATFSIQVPSDQQRRWREALQDLLRGRGTFIEEKK